MIDIDTEMEQWYAQQGHHLHKLVHRRPQRLTPEKVLIAAKKVYIEKIKNRKKIDRIMLAREVWREADELPDETVRKRFRNLSVNKDQSQRIAKLEQENKDYMITVIILLLSMLAMTLIHGG